jgi:hypothetical protein
MGIEALDALNRQLGWVRSTAPFTRFPPQTVTPDRATPQEDSTLGEDDDTAAPASVRLLGCCMAGETDCEVTTLESSIAL